MRPDRIIVGEVRGEEVLDMMQAMNTGHDGSLNHDPLQQPARCDLAHRSHDGYGEREYERAIHPSAGQFGGRSVCARAARFSDGTRRVTHITECVGMEGEMTTTQDIFLFEKTGITPTAGSPGASARTGIRPKFYEKLKGAGFQLPASMFQTVVEIS